MNYTMTRAAGVAGAAVSVTYANGRPSTASIAGVPGDYTFNFEGGHMSITHAGTVLASDLPASAFIAIEDGEFIVAAVNGTPLFRAGFDSNRVFREGSVGAAPPVESAAIPGAAPPPAVRSFRGPDGTEYQVDEEGYVGHVNASGVFERSSLVIEIPRDAEHGRDFATRREV